jgi:nucleoside-diphosphate-sugar epimerase
MDITIVGGHGSIAMLLHPILEQNGHSVRGIIRKEEQATELLEAGAEPVICDIETTDDISEAVGAADAVVFAAGAGPNSGAERKWTVDRDGAIKLIDAAKKNSISRYVMISAMGLEQHRGTEVFRTQLKDDEIFRTYLKAKAEADKALYNSELDYTIIKPGLLTNEAGSGKVKVGNELAFGEVPREDVAAVLAEVLEMPQTAGLQFNLLSGQTPIPKAVQSLLR